MVLLLLLHDTHTGFLLCYSSCTNRFVCLTSSIFCKISYEELDFNWNKQCSDYPLPKLHKEILMIYIYTGMLCVTAY